MGQAKPKDWNRGPSPWKGAALGAVIERPEHAYGLAIRLQHRLPAARITPGDLYPVLRRLDDNGLVTITRKLGESKGIYHATQLGVAAFEDWLRTPSTALPPVRNELFVKLAVARVDNRADLEAVLAQLDDAHAELLAQLTTAGVDEEDEEEIDAAVLPARALAQTLLGAQRDHALAHWQADLMVLDRTRRRLRRLLEALGS